MIPGRRLPTGREIAWHEAYHAAALCLAGMVPKCVRSDWPSDLEPGSVEIDWGPRGYRDPARAKDVLVSVVAGALTEGKRGWAWEIWPPDPLEVAEGARGDALFARELVQHFELDRVDWGHVLWKTEQLVRRQDFRRLVVRIANELERVEVLDADDLRALMEPDREAARGMTARLELKAVEATTRVADAQLRGAGAVQTTD